MHAHSLTRTHAHKVVHSHWTCLFRSSLSGNTLIIHCVWCTVPFMTSLSPSLFSLHKLWYLLTDTYSTSLLFLSYPHVPSLIWFWEEITSKRPQIKKHLHRFLHLRSQGETNSIIFHTKCFVFRTIDPSKIVIRISNLIFPQAGEHNK